MNKNQIHRSLALKDCRRVDNFVVVIVGPTATGKSNLAIQIAKKLNGEVVSADSRQVYKGLDKGTGKVTKKEMAGIPHHMLDIISPKKRFSVHDYVSHAEIAISQIQKNGHLPIVCGGTGFYIEALIDGIILPNVPANEALRKKLLQKTSAELFSLLGKKDPRRAESMQKNGDFKNPQRLIRAIEIALALGEVPVQKKVSKYNPVFIGLNFPPEELKQKIYTRLLDRIKDGMITEAKKLHNAGLSYGRMYELGLEYRHLAVYLKKINAQGNKKIAEKIARQELVADLSLDIWHYAKRQMTWFKRDTRIHWVHPKKSLKKVLEIIKN